MKRTVKAAGSRRGRDIIARLVPYFKPHRHLFAITLVFVLLKVGSDIFTLLTCKSILATLEHAVTREIPQGAGHSWWQVFLSITEVSKEVLVTADLWRIVAFMLGGIVLFMGAGYFRNLVPMVMIAHICFDMRRALYGHLQRMDLHFFNANRSGEITSRITNDITQGVQVFGHTVTVILYQVILFPFVVIYMLQTNVPLTIVALAIGVIFLINTRFFWNPLRRHSRDMHDKLGKMSGEVNEKLSAVKITQSFTNEEHEMGVFSSAIDAFRLSVIRMGKIQTFHSIMGQTIPKFGTCVVLAVGAALILKGNLTFAGLTFIWLMRERLFTPFVMFTNVSEQVFTGLGALDRVFDFFDLQATVTNNPRARQLQEVQGNLRFDDIFFSYSQRLSEPVLHDFSLDIAAGTSVAFIGQSGAGKTTAVDLISRFYDPDKGAVLLDGTDIREYSLQSLRAQIGVVLQDAILFSGTIEENVRYGKPDASRAEVRQALEMANAWDFIAEMKDGMRTEVGERGVTLSGGQKQRVAIARAFLKNPRILVLDEATSALDTISERQVQDAIERLMKDRTTIVIAHRLSTIRNVDQIVVFDKGTVVEKGSHEALLKKPDGFYSRYYSPQADGAEDDIKE